LINQHQLALQALHISLASNAQTACAWVDSTTLPVCKNQRIQRHKSLKQIATRGRSFALSISPSLVYAGTASDQLLCKDLEFNAHNLVPSVVNDVEFQQKFKSSSIGFVMGKIFKYQYKPTSRITLEGFPILWVYTGYEESRGVDRNQINKNYTRTTVSGELDQVKNVLSKNQSLGLNFNKHRYQNNKRGKYMYYVCSLKCSQT
jgi:hypothetical protein